MIPGTTRCHKSWFQEVNSLMFFNILWKPWRMFSICSRIQDVGTHMECTSKIIMVKSRNLYLDTIWPHETCRKGVFAIPALGPSDIWNLALGRECFAPWIWKRFDHDHQNFRVYWPTCVMTPWCLKLAPWRTVLRIKNHDIFGDLYRHQTSSRMILHDTMRLHKT